MTYFAQNLKHLRKRSARTQEQLGQEVQLGRTTIANYESGLSGPTDPEVLVRLAQLFGVSIDELLTRDLAQAITAPSAAVYGRELHSPAPPALARSGVPYVAREESGRYLELGSDGAYLDRLPAYGFPGLRSEEYRVFEVADAALAPRFEPGDRVLCRRVSVSEPLRAGAVYLVVSKAQGLLLRRLRLRDAGSWDLLGDDGSWVPVPVHEVRELWQAECLLSTRLQSAADNLQIRIADLEQQLQQLRANRT